MDIERLKEHIDDEAMEYAKNMMENPETHSFGKGIETGVLLCLKAINIEIARQSATSEEVQEAIEWVKDEIADLSYGDDEVEASYPHREDEILNTILNALLDVKRVADYDALEVIGNIHEQGD